jgi:hypothetical protein
MRKAQRKSRGSFPELESQKRTVSLYDTKMQKAQRKARGSFPELESQKRTPRLYGTRMRKELRKAGRRVGGFLQFRKWPEIEFANPHRMKTKSRRGIGISDGQWRMNGFIRDPNIETMTPKRKRSSSRVETPAGLFHSTPIRHRTRNPQDKNHPTKTPPCRVLSGPDRRGLTI